MLAVTSSIFTKLFMVGGLLALTTLGQPAWACALDVHRIIDVLRYTPRNQWYEELGCHFGSRFLIVDLNTKKVVASCPAVWMNTRADEIKLRGGLTLLDAVYSRRPVELRTNRGWRKFSPQYLESKSLGVLIVILKPVTEAGADAGAEAVR